FQAEDGIRDFHVTGVQTCALPILRARRACNASRCQLAHPPRREWPFSAALRPASFPSRCSSTFVNAWREDTDGTPDPDRAGIRRSEERRVGKEGRAGWAQFGERKR